MIDRIITGKLSIDIVWKFTFGYEWIRIKLDEVTDFFYKIK